MRRRELIQRFIHRERLLLVALRQRDFEFIDIDVDGTAAAAFLPRLAPGPLDEDAPHRLGCRGEEMRAIGEDTIAQANPGLMDQSGRLQSVPRLFPRHLGGGQTSQFGVDERHQIVQRDPGDGIGRR